MDGCQAQHWKPIYLTTDRQTAPASPLNLTKILQVILKTQSHTQRGKTFLRVLENLQVSNLGFSGFFLLLVLLLFFLLLLLLFLFAFQPILFYIFQRLYTEQREKKKKLPKWTACWQAPGVIKWSLSILFQIFLNENPVVHNSAFNLGNSIFSEKGGWGHRSTAVLSQWN